MINTQKSLSLNIILFVVTFSFIACTNAQVETPEWVSKLPTKRGYIYGAGTGKSSDLTMATKKARMNALTDLSNYYENKLEIFSKKCDTILGQQSNVKQVVTTIKTESNATFIGIEEVDKKVDPQYDLTTVYLLVRLDVRKDLDKIEDEIKKDKNIKKSSKQRLLEELNKL